MSKKRNKTAAELMTELESDPAFVERRRQQAESRRRLEEEMAQAEAPIVRDLRAAGASVTSAWDFVNGTEVTPSAVRVLLDHVGGPYPDRVREGVARALAVPESRVGWAKLVGLFVSDPDRSGLGSKFGLGCALASAVDADLLDEFIGLACDRRHGQNRIALLDGLAKMSDPKARATLQELADDPEVGPEVRRILSGKPRR